MYQAWELAAIDDAGYNGIREEHIERLAGALVQSGLSHIGNEEFRYYCHKCGMNPDNFTQLDIDRLQRRLDDF